MTESGNTRVPPQALEVEASVLGAMMMDPLAVDDVLEILSWSHFYKPQHQKIYKAIDALAARGEPVDLATVRAELERRNELGKIGGPVALMGIADSVLTSAYATAHARVVREKATLRELIRFSNTISQRCHTDSGDLSDLLEYTKAKISEIAEGANSSRLIEAIEVVMSTVKHVEINWIWNSFLPRSYMAAIDGDPGLGKSQFSLYVAAIVSRGYGFPGPDGIPGPETDPGTVILLSAEDGLGDTIAPRLQHCGADLNRIVAITGLRVRSSSGRVVERAVALQDVADIERVVERHKAPLVIVDPIQAYFGSEVDMGKANETRSVLKAIHAMCQRQRCTVLFVRHLTKMGQRAIAAGQGNIDISGACRSVMLATKNPDKPGEFLLAHTKCNLAPLSRTQGYSLTGGFHWTQTDDRSADDLAAEMSRTPGSRPTWKSFDETSDWLLAKLTNSPNHQLISSQIFADAKHEGFSEKGIRRAQKELPIKIRREGGFFMWKLEPKNTI